MLFFSRDTKLSQTLQHGRWMTVEDFRDFFEVGIGMVFYKMRCSKSCYLYDLELVALFDVVEQGGFFGDDFLVDRTTDFYFCVACCLISLFQAIIVLIFTLNTLAVCVNECPSFAYSSARSLKSLSYDMRRFYWIFSYISRQLAI